MRDAAHLFDSVSAHKANICNKFNSIQDYDQQSIFAHIYLNLHTFIEISREQNTWSWA